MSTLAQLIGETQGILLSGGREQYAMLNGAINSSVTSITIDHNPGIYAGSILEIDSELIYTWSASPFSDITRGWLGTTAATHADNAVVTINPRFPVYRIIKALADEIASYTSPVHGLYRIATTTLTAGGNTVGYDLAGAAAGLVDIYDVRWSEPGSVGNWARIQPGKWELVRDAYLAEFPSGYGLRLYDEPLPGRSIRVQYKAAFSALGTTLASDVTTTTGLHAEALDIPPMGAAVRLVAPREIRRSTLDAQPEPRQAADVPPGTSRNAAGGLLALRNQRLAEERARLQGRYPTLKRI